MTSEMFGMKAVKSGPCWVDRHSGTLWVVGVAAQLHMLLLILTSQSYSCTSKHYSIIKKGLILVSPQSESGI